LIVQQNYFSDLYPAKILDHSVFFLCASRNTLDILELHLFMFANVR